MSRYPRAHGKPAGVKNIRPGTKKHIAGLDKPKKWSEETMNAHMRGLEGEHRSIYANPYKRTQERRERRLTNKPL